MSEPIEHIVIIGGDLNSWVAASILSRSVVGMATKITLIEEPNNHKDLAAQSLVASAGYVHKRLSIKETELIGSANATFKLGNLYRNWAKKGQQFCHTQNEYGRMLESIEFHQVLNKFRLLGKDPLICNYSLSARAGLLKKFAHPRPVNANQPRPMFDPYSYAWHVETSGYLSLLKEKNTNNITSIKRGVSSVERDAETGFINAVVLDDGEKIYADFFIDASQNHSAIKQQLNDVEYESWDNYIGCDRVLSWTETIESDAAPCSELQLHEYGWQKIIPLQNKQAVEFYYCSKFLTDAEAQEHASLKNKPPKHNAMVVKKIQPGKCNQFWRKNYLFIGEAAGQIGDFAVSNLHLTQSAILRFMDFYPLKSCDATLAYEYNRLTNEEYERILDFDNLHYVVAQSINSPFWMHMHAHTSPKSLQHKLALFKKRGNFPFYERETFSKKVWVSFLLGNDIWPEKTDPLLEGKDLDKLLQQSEAIERTAHNIAMHMPDHNAYLLECIQQLS